MIEYQVKINQPNRRWKVIHRLPDGGQAIYFVSRGKGSLSCSCPGYRYGKKPCKHCVYVANLIQEPILVAPF